MTESHAQPLTRRRAVSRRGMTFLEVVFAAAMLGLVVSVVFGAIGFMMSRQRVEQQTLGATETASRLMLQYLDNPFEMPDESLPVEYGPDRYRWSMTKAPLRIKPAEPAIKSAAASVVAIGPGGISSGDTPGGSNRLIEASDLVTIRVWLSEESGGSLTPEATVPHSTINRIIYPILAGRNPDSFNNLRTNDEWVRSMRDKIGGGSGGGTTTTGNGAGAGKRGGSPGTGSRPAARPNRLPSKGPNP